MLQTRARIKVLEKAERVAKFVRTDDFFWMNVCCILLGILLLVLIFVLALLVGNGTDLVIPSEKERGMFFHNAQLWYAQRCTNIDSPSMEAFLGAYALQLLELPKLIQCFLRPHKMVGSRGKNVARSLPPSAIRWGRGLSLKTFDDSPQNRCFE